MIECPDFIRRLDKRLFFVFEEVRREIKKTSIVSEIMNKCPGIIGRNQILKI